MRVGIVGLGQIADGHLTELRKMESVQVLAMCDVFQTPLDALAEKFGIPGKYRDLGQMLAREDLDVVHVTTPPASHYPLGRMILESGVNLYMEKPFTVTYAETEALIRLADDKGLKICMGTHRLFSQEFLEARREIEAGTLGDLTHIDVIYSYSLGGIFGKQVLANPGHWIARLPGQIFQNNLSHALGFIVPFLGPRFSVSAFSADFSGNGVVDEELRLQIVDLESKRTASVVFSTNLGTAVCLSRYFGTKSSAYVDHINHTFLLDSKPAFPGNLGLAFKVRSTAKTYGRQYRRALLQFLFGKESYFSDMNRLIAAFYRSIEKETPPPISPEEIRKSALIMEEMIAQTQSASEG